MNQFFIQTEVFAALWFEAVTRASLLGGLAILLAWSLTRAFPRMPAAARDWLWRLAYLKLLVAFFWAAPIELPLLPAPASPVIARAIPTKELPAEPAAAAQFSAGSPQKAPLVPELTAPRDSSEAITRTTLLFAAWLFGAGVCSLLLFRQWLMVRRRVRAAVPVTNIELQNIAAELLQTAGVSKCPPLLIGRELPGPVLAGIFRPVILLPESFAENATSAESRVVLAHELAHWRRRDLLWNWPPAIAHVLFFFHPAVWIARRESRLAQEMACDEAAIRLARVPAADYAARLLTIVQQCRGAAPASVFAIGMSPSFHSLSKRIHAMHTIKPLSTRARRALLALLLATAAVGLVPWRITAAAAGPDAAPKEAPFVEGDDLETLKADAKLPGRIVVQCGTRRADADEGEQFTYDMILEVNPNTGRWRPITQGGLDIRLSPDGEKVALVRATYNPVSQKFEKPGMWICPRSGSLAWQVTDVGGRPIWSRDGKWLVSTAQELNEEDKKAKPDKPVWDNVTWRVKLDGSEKTKLPIPMTDAVSDWSPDGQWFVTTSDRHPPFGRGYQLYLMRTNGTEERRLTQGAGLNVYARFSPDGKKIVYLHQEKGENSIRVMDLDSGKETVVIKDDGLTIVRFACWSPDGNHLAVWREDWEEGAKSENPTLSVLNLATKSLREIKLEGVEVLYFNHGDWR